MKFLRLYLIIAICIIFQGQSFADECDAGLDAFSDCGDTDQGPLDSSVWVLIIAAGAYGLKSVAPMRNFTNKV